MCFDLLLSDILLIIRRIQRDIMLSTAIIVIF
jgi:hypothetical protein